MQGRQQQQSGSRLAHLLEPFWLLFISTRADALVQQASSSMNASTAARVEAIVKIGGRARRS